MKIIVFLFLCFAPTLSATQADDLFRSGAVALQGQHYPEAEAAFRELYRLEPETSRGVIGIAQVYIAQGKPDDAMDLLRSETKKYPERADLHIAMGTLAASLKQTDTALAEFKTSLGLMDAASKDRSVVYLKISDVYRAQGDLKAALDTLRAAVELAPQDPAILTNYAMALEQSGDKQNSVRQYRAALAIKQENPIALNNLAFLMAETGGDLYEALRFARLARQAAPQSLEIADTVGWVALKLGWIDDAFGTFSDLVRKQPGNKSFRDHLVLAIDQKQPPSTAMTELKKALLADPSPENQKAVVELLGKH